MSTRAKVTALLIACLLVLVGSTSPQAALSCSPMKPGQPNNKFAGNWLLGDTHGGSCLIQINNVGKILSSSTCKTGTSPIGTITGTLVVSSNCKVTGSYHVITQTLNQQYAVNASMAESVQSASTILGFVTYPPYFIKYHFWMIQTP